MRAKLPTPSLADSARLSALSPVDGRYADKTDALRAVFSEYGLLRYRTRIEIEWLKKLAATPGIKECPPLSSSAKQFLDKLADGFALADARRIKTIEKKTRHDIKAVEYFLRERFSKHRELKNYTHFLHFACTSWDINNLAYALMLKDGRDEVLLPAIKQVHRILVKMAKRDAGVAMMSRTHGQPASPTTMGKEVANFAYRLDAQAAGLRDIRLDGKVNGAVGNYNAHLVAYPKVNWESLTRQFVNKLGLRFNPYTTQIEPYDSFAEYLHALVRTNTIALDLCRDMWTYISLDYFKQKTTSSHVGSSTMPHKVNPIDFENAEGNIGVANAILEHLASRLCVSRLQRDLSDSTALRALGSGLGHTLIAWHSLAAGLEKLTLNKTVCANDLKAHSEILGEALQTVMRKNGMPDAYEYVKKMTRGKVITQERFRQLVDKLDLNADDKRRLLALTPETYTGLAKKLASQINKSRK